MCFNPCCAGCSSGSAGQHHEYSFILEVSILVVLDVVLEVDSSDILYSDKNGFNPCCAGCSSGSQRGAVCK